MKNTLKKIGFLALSLTLVAGLSMGCRKKKDTIAEITVKNASGAIVSGAHVRLYPKPTQGYEGAGALLWEFESTTNSSGVASFNFNEIYQLGQAGVVVANIDATHNGSSGTGIIKVEQETTSTATVFL
jgi:hypothetical protein